jgi:DNA-binding response OmpR family regulator
MFLSAAAYESDKEAAIRNGAQRYLVKPGDIHLLKSEVEALMAPSVNKHDQAGVAQSHSYLSEGADAESKAYGSMGFVASQLLTTPGA